MSVGNRQPRCASRETGAGAVVPRHRCTATIAALEGGPEVFAIRVLQCFVRHVRFAQAEFLTLVDAGRTAQAAQQCGEQAGQRGIALLATPAADDPAHVVVGDRPARPALRHRGFQGAQRIAEMRGTEVVGKQLEAVGHVQATFGGVLRHRLERIFRRYFAQAHRTGIAVEQRTQLGQKRQVFGLGVVVIVVLECVRVIWAEAAADSLRRRLGRVVAQQAVVKTEVDGIQAQPINATIQPEAHDIEHRSAYFRVVKVQVRLRSQKVVQVILATTRFPLPGDTTENRQPVVRRAAVGLGVGPDIPVGLGVVTAAAAFLEPFVLDRVVAQYLIDHHLQAKSVCLGQQPVEIGQGAE